MGSRMEKKVTIVIPNYNGSDYLRACLDSVLAGSLVPKVIVVDNGSWIAPAR